MISIAFDDILGLKSFDQDGAAENSASGCNQHLRCCKKKNAV
jgi:hypothetical protein